MSFENPESQFDHEAAIQAYAEAKFARLKAQEDIKRLHQASIESVDVLLQDKTDEVAREAARVSDAAVEEAENHIEALREAEELAAQPILEQEDPRPLLEEVNVAVERLLSGEQGL